MTFDPVADVYHDVRPGYPARLFESLFAMLPVRPRVLEVGPGTGQATRSLLEHGARVHAVEIGASMARKLRDVLPDPRLHVTTGDFEQEPPAGEMYDCVFAATAYHWVEPTAQVDRPATLLRDGGVLAVVDTTQVESPTDHGFFDAAQPIYQRYGEGRTEPNLPGRDSVDPPMRAALEADARFSDVDVRPYDWDQTYTAAQYRQLMLSYSATQALEPTIRHGLLDDMEELVNERFGGSVTRPLVITLTTARLHRPA